MVETFFTEKRIIKKIIIVLIFIFMFNFTFSYLGSNVVFADEESGVVKADTDMQAIERWRKIIIANIFIVNIYNRCNITSTSK